MDILKVVDVEKRFVGHMALDGVSLSVPRGSIYGLLGPNGAGKTTMLRIINHITAPDSGSVEFDGHPLVADDVKHIGYLPEERGLFRKMKVGEQAMFFARLKGMSRRDAERELRGWFNRMGMSDWWNRRIEELSKGMAQKVQFVVTVVHNPKLLIFDEPFSGFDPINARMLKEQILRQHEEGATIIISTHNMASVEELCDHITLINNSHAILQGNVDEIRRRYGSNRFAFTFAGDATALDTAFADIIIERGSVEEINPAHGIVRQSLRFADGVDRRALIARANDIVDLHGFEDDLPSMDEIFIRSVESSNSKS